LRWYTQAAIAILVIGQVTLALRDTRSSFDEIVAFLFVLSILVISVRSSIWLIRSTNTVIDRFDRWAVGRLSFPTYQLACFGVTLVGMLHLCAYAALKAEEQASSGSALSSYPRAVFWALSTMTTNGPGEYYPSSSQGHFVAAVTMLVGVVLFGGMLAALVAEFWQEGTKQARVRLEVEQPTVTNEPLLERLEALTTVVESLSPRSAKPGIRNEAGSASVRDRADTGLTIHP
jgi:voltage-gated potassium channel